MEPLILSLLEPLRQSNLDANFLGSFVTSQAVLGHLVASDLRV